MDNLARFPTSANIPHRAVSATWGNPYIGIVTKWNTLPYSRQQSIRAQYPGIEEIAGTVSSVEHDFANVLSKTTPEVRCFVNDFAIPVTTISTAYKSTPTTLLKAANTVTSFLIDVAEEFNRLMIPGYSVWDDGGDTREIVTSAGSDLVLTLVGGKAIKLGWKGAKALYDGAKALGNTLVGRKPVAIENRLFLEQPKMIRHHLFNRFWQQNESTHKYREFFRKHGIKVDDFCVELPRTTHINTIHQRQNDWTNRWKIWIDSNPEATTKEVFQFAGSLMDEYGISHVPIVKYRK